MDVRIIVPHVAHDAWHGPADDGHVLRPAHSIRVTGEGSSSQATLTPAAYGALRRLFARERFRSAAHPCAGGHRPVRLGAGDVRRPDRRHDSQLLHAHLEANADRALVPLRHGAHDAGDRGQRVGARRDGALRALRQHDHRQRRRLRRVPGRPPDAAVRGRHDQHPERRPARAPQRHRRRDRRVRAAGPRTAAHAAAARR